MTLLCHLLGCNSCSFNLQFRLSVTFLPVNLHSMFPTSPTPSHSHPTCTNPQPGIPAYFFIQLVRTNGVICHPYCLLINPVILCPLIGSVSRSYMHMPNICTHTCAHMHPLCVCHLVSGLNRCSAVRRTVRSQNGQWLWMLRLVPE